MAAQEKTDQAANASHGSQIHQVSGDHNISGKNIQVQHTTNYYLGAAPLYVAVGLVLAGATWLFIEQRSTRLVEVSASAADHFGEETGAGGEQNGPIKPSARPDAVPATSTSLGSASADHFAEGTREPKGVIQPDAKADAVPDVSVSAGSARADHFGEGTGDEQKDRIKPSGPID